MLVLQQRTAGRENYQGPGDGSRSKCTSLTAAPCKQSHTCHSAKRLCEAPLRSAGVEVSAAASREKPCLDSNGTEREEPESVFKEKPGSL